MTDRTGRTGYRRYSGKLEPDDGEYTLLAQRVVRKDKKHIEITLSSIEDDVIYDVQGIAVKQSDGSYKTGPLKPTVRWHVPPVELKLTKVKVTKSGCCVIRGAWVEEGVDYGFKGRINADPYKRGS